MNEGSSRERHLQTVARRAEDLPHTLDVGGIGVGVVGTVEGARLHIEVSTTT